MWAGVACGAAPGRVCGSGWRGGWKDRAPDLLLKCEVGEGESRRQMRKKTWSEVLEPGENRAVSRGSSFTCS